MTPGKSVLVVDDGRHYRRLFKEVFGDVMPGSPFFALESGVAAVEHLSRAPDVPIPDVVLLDRQMPGLDGFETLLALRDIEAVSHVPVIMISGSSDPVHIAQARAAGAAGYMVKPPDVNGYEELARQVAIWKPEPNWLAKEIVGIACEPVVCALSQPMAGALPSVRMSNALTLPDPVAIAAASPLISKEPFHVLMALNEAGIDLALLADTSCNEDVVNNKRKVFARVMQRFGYATRQIQRYVPFSDKWFEKRRAEGRKS